MITRIVINHVKEGHKGEYIEVSKAFLKELKETCGLIEGGVFEVEETENDVINVEKWPDKETAEAVLKSPVFQKYMPQLMQFFNGNETMILHEK